MPDTVTHIKSWLPIVLVGASVIASAAVLQFQTSVHAAELTDQEQAVTDNAKDINDLQKIIITRQGEVELKMQRFEMEQEAQSEVLEDIQATLQQILQIRH